MSFNRRCLLRGAASAPLLGQLALGAQTVSRAPASKLAIPGLFPGRVIGIEDQRSIVSNRYNAAVIQPMMHRGMKELTGSDDWTAAWKLFFQKGDVVGIKVNPVGQPHVISAPEVLHVILDGLKAAGIPNQD
ncbi:MAG TPA: hypothetical protein VM120_04335, partial [Bryobacteraceae bacterium]|nr:hypothetical protein [Bryobacteraceae bacterium]